jgi:hypothetical protein
MGAFLLCSTNIHLIITKETSSTMLVGDCIPLNECRQCERTVEMYTQSDDSAQIK